MKIINTLGTPDLIHKVVQANWYNGKDVGSDGSVTELLAPVTKTILSRRHDSEIEVEADGLIIPMLGSATHEMISRIVAGEPGRYFSEIRVTRKVGDATVTGGIDLVDFLERKITDFKVTTVFQYQLHGGLNPDWAWQLNMYRYLFSLAFPGVQVDRLTVIVIFRDWVQYKANQENDGYGKNGTTGYPPSKSLEIEVPVFPLEEVERFIIERTEEIASFSDTPDSALPVCSPAERWDRPTMYEVWKPENKASSYVSQNEFAARNYISKRANKAGYEIRVIPGRRTRCLEYCSASAFCPHFKAYTEALSANKLVSSYKVLPDMLLPPPGSVSNAQFNQVGQAEEPKQETLFDTDLEPQPKKDIVE